jgi:hypothetical protein
VDYFQRPVKIEQFIDDPYYLGQTLRNDIYPKIKQRLIDLFDGEYAKVPRGGCIALDSIVYEEDSNCDVPRSDKSYKND